VKIIIGLAVAVFIGWLLLQLACIIPFVAVIPYGLGLCG
jgi:hypothetical protein